MVTCGCNSTCNCVVQAGTGTTVSGSGSVGDPYVINATAGDFTVTDTNSVDLTKTGSDIKADVIRDPEATNLLAIGPAGLDVPCESVQDCVGQGFAEGLIYDDALNQYRVRISADPGNVTTIGTDDGVFTPSTPVTLGCGVEFDTFGAIAVDTAGDFADLTRRNCSEVADAPGTTPLAGPDTVGQLVYCDANGDLRVAPEKFSEVAQSQINEAHVPAITVLPFTTTPIQIGFTNPSSQYCMCGYVQFAAIPAISGAPGTMVEIIYEHDDGDGIFVQTSNQTMDNRGKSATSGLNNRVPLLLNICLDPGETKIIRFRVLYQRAPGDNGAAVTITGTAREIRAVGSNL